MTFTDIITLPHHTSKIKDTAECRAKWKDALKEKRENALALLSLLQNF